jgi:hypothetical protein
MQLGAGRSRAGRAPGLRATNTGSRLGVAGRCGGGRRRSSAGGPRVGCGLACQGRGEGLAQQRPGRAQLRRGRVDPAQLFANATARSASARSARNRLGCQPSAARPLPAVNHLVSRAAQAGPRMLMMVSRVHKLITAQRRCRNQPGGYWVAAANPAAAYEAVTGSLPRSLVTRAALLSDGVSCLVERYAAGDWRWLLAILQRHGPRHVISRVREAEHTDPAGARWPRYKRSDDATAAFCLLS